MQESCRKIQEEVAIFCQNVNYNTGPLEPHNYFKNEFFCYTFFKDVKLVM
jgi:hypothetical protein